MFENLAISLVKYSLVKIKMYSPSMLGSFVFRNKKGLREINLTSFGAKGEKCNVYLRVTTRIFFVSLDF